jgi:hypothetical protein
MLIKREASVRFGNGFLPIEVDALELADIPATAKRCMDGAANFRAMELAGKIADDRAKGMPSAVYIVAPADVPVCKIGIAADPASRLLSLQGGNWNQLGVAALLWGDVGVAYEIEQLALRAAKEMDIYLRGEWIAADPAEACEIVLKAARHCGKPVFDSETWLGNWSVRLNAVAEAMGRDQALGKLAPRSRKTAA